MADAIIPDRAQFDALRALPGDAPVDHINLIRFRDEAEYPADHECAGAGLSGADAYLRFTVQSGPLFNRLGGHLVWSGVPEQVLVGPADERWDAAYITHFPRADGFLAMLVDPVYLQAEVHRKAGVADTRVIRCVPRAAGEKFAWP